MKDNKLFHTILICVSILLGFSILAYVVNDIGNIINATLRFLLR